MTFRESDLNFKFSDAHWQIKKYDTHRYFKILSGAGLKGVDFLGIYQQRAIVFFEIKHFHTNHPTKEPVYLIFDDPNIFINSIADKLEDTVRAVHIIIQYLQRKRWYRIFTKWNHWVPINFIQHKDWYFWHQVFQIMQHKEQRILVLWLEMDHHFSAISKKNLSELADKNLESELLDLVGTVEIANRENPVFKESLEVS